MIIVNWWYWMIRRKCLDELQKNRFENLILTVSYTNTCDLFISTTPSSRLPGTCISPSLERIRFYLRVARNRTETRVGILIRTAEHSRWISSFLAIHLKAGQACCRLMSRAPPSGLQIQRLPSVRDISHQQLACSLVGFELIRLSNLNKHQKLATATGFCTVRTMYHFKKSFIQGDLASPFSSRFLFSENIRTFGACIAVQNERSISQNMCERALKAGICWQNSIRSEIWRSGRDSVCHGGRYLSLSRLWMLLIEAVEIEIPHRSEIWRC
jgi:hypothetical protein